MMLSIVAAELVGAIERGEDRSVILAKASAVNGVLAELERIDSYEALAKRFHEAYERLAPQFGYETRQASAVPWEQVPEQNRKLMIATVQDAVSGDVPEGALHLLEAGWGLISNAGNGDWSNESAQWREIATRWRLLYHLALSRWGA